MANDTISTSDQVVEQPTNARPHTNKQRQDKQTTSTIAMVRPASFHHNFETAIDNSYQERPESLTEEEARSLGTLPRDEAYAKHPGLQQKTDALDVESHAKASQEFEAMVALLRSKMIEVIVISDVLENDSPDSVFACNPIAFHPENGGTVILYPMKSTNRRPERSLPIPETLAGQFGFQITNTIDLSGLEASEDFLEGNGSMVLDRQNRIVYASISQRTTPKGVAAFAEKMEYKVVSFRSVHKVHNADVYHTNVVMSVGNKFAVICSEAIPDVAEREMVLASLRETGKDIIEISTDQMDGYAGNNLEVRSVDGNPIIVMSQTAYNTLTAEQRTRLGQYGEVVPVPLPTIEKDGGGSARCMMLEVHLPKKENAEGVDAA